VKDDTLIDCAPYGVSLVGLQQRRGGAKLGCRVANNALSIQHLFVW